VTLGAAVLVAVLALAGCGGGKSGGSAGSSSAGSSPSTSAATSPSSSPGSGSGGQKLTITPSTALRSGQKVKLSATGFSPGETLVVTECANKGQQTGAGDCDVSALQPVTADSSGHVQAEYTVTKGPFGSDHVVCSTPNSCIISITQATPTPSQEANAPISFG
jgi:hypothetical protein